MNKQKNPLGYYIGYVTNSEHRYRASSGGIGTMLQKHLLSSGQYGTSITFRFNAYACMYEPVLIHSAEEIIICGSIYQDIDIARFIQAHIGDITDGIVVSCPPCQVSAIRNILKKESIPCFIISFCCSGQTTIEGTWKYYELLGIKKEEVINMQYRGNGWPSGIQIWLKDGAKIVRDNYTEPWKTIHNSWLYRPKRCFFCTLDTGKTADVSLADPWLDDYKLKDKEGNTLFLVNTETGMKTITHLKSVNDIAYEEVNNSVYYTAQKNNISKANSVNIHKKRIQRTLRFVNNPIIRHVFSRNTLLLQLFIKLRQHF